MRKLLFLATFTILLVGCNAKQNDNSENADSVVTQESEKILSEQSIESPDVETGIIVDFLKSQQFERYCQVDIDGDNREEIVAYGDDSYFVYAKNADIISSAEQITELASTFGLYYSAEYGSNHIVISVCHIGNLTSDEGESWCEYFSTELKNSTIVSETSFTGLKEEDDINNCEHGPSSNEMQACSKEDALNHFPTYGMTNFNDMEYIELTY